MRDCVPVRKLVGGRISPRRVPLPTMGVCAGDIGNRCARTWVTPKRHTAPPTGGAQDAVAGGYPDVVARGVCAVGNASRVNRRELCRRFGISAKTGYKWLERHAAEGGSGLEDRSRQPQRSPLRTAAVIERARHRAAPRVAQLVGRAQAGAAAGGCGRPTSSAPSTITGILRRARPAGRRPLPQPRPLAALRARGAQRPVADGLQGLLRLARAAPAAIR